MNNLKRKLKYGCMYELAYYEGSRWTEEKCRNDGSEINYGCDL